MGVGQGAGGRQGGAHGCEVFGHSLKPKDTAIGTAELLVHVRCEQGGLMAEIIAVAGFMFLAAMALVVAIKS